MSHIASAFFNFQTDDLVIFSPLGSTNPSTVNPYYIVPFFDRLFCCFPKSCRRKLWCSVPVDEAYLDENGHALTEGEDDDDKDEVSLL